MNDTVIQLDHVTKEFTSDFWKKRVRAVSNVSFAVQSGDVWGLVGPNGAGKTTIIKMLMGLVKPTEGKILVCGKETSDVKIKRSIGYLPENAYYYDYLTTEEVLDFYGRLFGYSKVQRKQKTDELLHLVGLSDRRGLRLRHYSKGMLQRIGIAQALINDPDVVIFDEPMSGLDPVGRKEVRDLILRLSERKKTILFSSHILSDVEQICEKVAILIKGELRACGSIHELVKPQVRDVEMIFKGASREAVDRIPWQNEVERRLSGELLVTRFQNDRLIPEMIAWGHKENLSLISLVPHRESLEDLFLKELER